MGGVPARGTHLGRSAAEGRSGQLFCSEAMREEPRERTEGASAAGKIVGSDGCSGTEPPIGRRQRARRDWSAEPKETCDCQRVKRGGRCAQRSLEVDAQRPFERSQSTRPQRAADFSPTDTTVRRVGHARASDGRCQPPCRSARTKPADFGSPKGPKKYAGITHRTAARPRARARTSRVPLPIQAALVSSVP